MSDGLLPVAFYWAVVDDVGQFICLFMKREDADEFAAANPRCIVRAGIVQGCICVGPTG